MSPRPKLDALHTRDVIWAAIFAGVIGGVVMGLAMTLRSAVVGEGSRLPFKLIASVYLGVDALLGCAGIIVIGIVTHLIVAASFGVVFAVIVRGRPGGVAAVIAGVLFGLLVCAIMMSWVLPWADRTMYERAAESSRWIWAFHAVYGVTLALGPTLARAIHRGHAQSVVAP